MKRILAPRVATCIEDRRFIEGRSSTRAIAALQRGDRTPARRRRKSLQHRVALDRQGQLAEAIAAWRRRSGSSPAYSMARVNS